MATQGADRVWDAASGLTAGMDVDRLLMTCKQLTCLIKQCNHMEFAYIRQIYKSCSLSFAAEVQQNARNALAACADWQTTSTG